jgi:hypothetical protein
MKEMIIREWLNLRIRWNITARQRDILPVHYYLRLAFTMSLNTWTLINSEDKRWIFDRNETSTWINLLSALLTNAQTVHIIVLLLLQIYFMVTQARSV